MDWIYDMTREKKEVRRTPGVFDLNYLNNEVAFYCSGEDDRTS